jgi:hypothetical protein
MPDIAEHRRFSRTPAPAQDRCPPDDAISRTRGASL